MPLHTCGGQRTELRSSGLMAASCYHLHAPLLIASQSHCGSYPKRPGVNLTTSLKDLVSKYDHTQVLGGKASMCAMVGADPFKAGSHTGTHSPSSRGVDRAGLGECLN